jgi:hypothetical protein
VEVLDPSRYYCLNRNKGAFLVRRQRVVNNLPGTPAYCPLVRRTETLSGFERTQLNMRAHKQLSRFPQEVLHRAVQYLYVKETQPSYQIEHMQPARIHYFPCIGDDEETHEAPNRSERTWKKLPAENRIGRRLAADLPAGAGAGQYQPQPAAHGHPAGHGLG